LRVWGYLIQTLRYADGQFRLHLLLSYTGADKIENAYKEHFMQTNFDAGQTIVEFSNAFCVKDEKDERVIQCVCCEYSEVDKFCEFFNIVR
jgi:hypothetical protein